MKGVVDLYVQELVSGKARICFDERPYQLLGEVMVSLPIKAGKPEKEVLCWSENRNGKAAKAHCSFTVITARRKVVSLIIKIFLNTVHLIRFVINDASFFIIFFNTI